MFIKNLVNIVLMSKMIVLVKVVVVVEVEINVIVAYWVDWYKIKSRMKVRKVKNVVNESLRFIKK